jgi:hypothetical protein
VVVAGISEQFVGESAPAVWVTATVTTTASATAATASASAAVCAEHVTF